MSARKRALQWSQFDLLETLASYGRGVTIAELVARTGKSRDTVKRQLTRAQRSGLVAKRWDRGWQTAAEYAPSPLGWRRMRETFAWMDAQQEAAA